MKNYMTGTDVDDEQEFPNAVRYDEQGEIIFMQDIIMEGMLGRKLSDNEIVLHKNGNSLDNQRANLYLILVLDDGDTALVVREPALVL